MEKLDNFDRSILRVLQADGKIGNQDLAEKVNLSSSPCWRRVRKLEDSGVIDSYVAMLNPKSLGLTAMAYVHIALLDHRQKTIETLRQLCSHSRIRLSNALRSLAPTIIFLRLLRQILRVLRNL